MKVSCQKFAEALEEFITSVMNALPKQEESKKKEEKKESKKEEKKKGSHTLEQLKKMCMDVAKKLGREKVYQTLGTYGVKQTHELAPEKIDEVYGILQQMLETAPSEESDGF